MTTVHGRDVGFTRNVWANIEISKLTPDGDISSFGEALSSMNFADSMEAMISMILILNKAYEMQMAFEDPEYNGSPLTRDEILLLNDEQFQALTEAAMAQFSEDSQMTIEAEAKNTGGEGTPK